LSRKQFTTWQQFLDWLRNRHYEGRDTTIHVVGDERGGKSSFALNLFKTINPQWNILDGLFNDWEDLNPILRRTHKRFLQDREQEMALEVGEQLPYWPFFWGDEATNILDVLDFNKQENKAIKKLFRQWGYLKALVVLIDPDGRLDRYVMKHRAKVKVIMDERGKARVQLQQRDRDLKEDPWYEDQFIWGFPDPAFKWPNDTATYLAHKFKGIDNRLDETSDVFEQAKAQRLESRLRRENNIRRLRQEIDTDA
jgi:hypothetical protein